VSTPPSGGERCWRSPNFEWHALCEPLALRALAQLVKLSERGRARSGRPHPATFLTRGSDSRTNAERGRVPRNESVAAKNPKYFGVTQKYFEVLQNTSAQNARSATATPPRPGPSRYFRLLHLLQYSENTCIRQRVLALPFLADAGPPRARRRARRVGPVHDP
jgi:hypothetical protein